MIIRITRYHITLFVLFALEFVCIRVPSAQEQAFTQQELVEQYIDQLYREAVNLYKEGEYERAKVKFIQVKVRNSDYKATETFLNRIVDHLAFQEKQEAEQEKRAALRERQAQETAEKRSSKIDRRLRTTKDNVEQRQREQLRQQQKVALAEKKRIARARKILEKQKRREEQAARRQQQLEAKRLAREQQQIKEKIAADEKQARLAARKAEKVTEKLDSPNPAPATSQEKIHQILQERVEGLTGKKESHQERLEEKRARYQQDQKTAQTQEAYRDVLSSCKAKRYDYAWERLADLKKLLQSQQLPESYRQKMSKKAESLEWKVKQSEQKDQWLKDRAQLKEEERQARINEKAQRKAQKQKELVSRPPDVPQRPTEEAEDSTQLKGKTAEATKKVVSALPAGRPKKIAAPVKPFSPKKETSQSALQVKASEPVDSRQHQLQQALEQGIAELYHDGVELYSRGSWDLAQQVFQEIDKLSPDYKHTRHYLELIDSHLRPQPLETLVPNRRTGTGRSKSMIVAETLDSYDKTEKKEDRK